MLLAIIPARSGSTRIANKNIIDFNGKPLISYALNAIKNSKIFDKIHVSTDSEAYADIIKELGYEIDFLRCSKMSKDEVGISEVLRWVVSEYEKRGEEITEVCMVMATAPLIEASDINKLREIYLKHNGLHPVLAVTTFPAPIEQGLKITKDGTLGAVFPNKFHLQTQNLKKVYQDAGALFYIGRDQLMKNNVKAYSTCYPLILEREKVIDIDDYEDLAFAEALYLGLQAKRRKK